QYCKQVWGQLAKKEQRLEKRCARLIGDGLPRLLTKDDFYELVRQYEEELRAAAAEKEQRSNAQDLYLAAVKAWKTSQELRAQRNVQIHAGHVEEQAQWTAEHNLARAEKREPHWDKPGTLRDRLIAATPKLNKKDFLAAIQAASRDDSSSEDSGEEEED
ncbi:hypothetical protein OF83DRAFT_1062200, partial [Amylostereum chailletii]